MEFEEKICIWCINKYLEGKGDENFNFRIVFSNWIMILLAIKILFTYRKGIIFTIKFLDDIFFLYKLKFLNSLFQHWTNAVNEDAYESLFSEADIKTLSINDFTKNLY